MSIGRRCALGCLGGVFYIMLELAWRGWSHWTMFLAGGACFLLIGHLGELRRPMPVWGQVIAGAGIITMVELAAGLLINRDHRIWDYSALPGNFMGQICLPFTLLWFPVSLAAVTAYARLSRALTKAAPPDSPPL